MFGLNFPVARLGFLGALAVAFIPLATGLDAMRQLVFADAAFPVGTPSPPVEVGILAVMTVVSIAGARWMLLTMERRARRDGRLSVRWQ